MFILARISRSALGAILCFLTVACTVALTNLPQVSDRQANERSPKRGIRIIRIFEGTTAELAGLRTMDVLSRYGEFEIVDYASYFRARDAYEMSPDEDIQLVVWRGNIRMTPVVRAGRLGIEMNEYNPVSYEFDSRMNRLRAMQELENYEGDPAFNELFANPPAVVLQEVRNLIDRAEKEGRLTPAQILVARIYMISDDALPEDLEQQSHLLEQLISTYPISYIEFLGSDFFFKKKRYRPASACFKKYLETEPEDVSIRLNLGFASNRVGMFDEAEAAADYVIDNKLELSEYGSLVYYGVKAVAALGQRDYRKAIFFGEKYFELKKETFQISLLQLAAAQNGDLKKLEDISKTFREVLPDKYEKLKFQIDAVEAYGLVKNNQLDRAQQLVRKWKGTEKIEFKLKRYWGGYPGGSDILRNWQELMQD